jgi:hypothetical protein
MINVKKVFGLVALASLVLAGGALAGEKVYSATGKILHATSTLITVRTSAQDLELMRDAKTKVTAELRQETPVSVVYDKVGGQPHAVEVNPVGGAKPAKAKP